MSNQNLEEIYLNIKEASSFLNLKESKLRYMIFKKEIPIIKFGRLVRFCKNDLTIWIEKLKRN